MSSANVLPSAPAYGDREETQLYPSLPTNAENFRLTEISKIEKEISAEAEHYRLVLKKYKKVRKVIHYSVVCLGAVTAALSSGAVATSLTGVGIVIGVPVAAVAGISGAASTGLSVINKKLERKVNKHSRILALAVAKHDSINSSVSQALNDNRFVPYIQKGNEGLVHHLVIYECHNRGQFNDSVHYGPGYDCNDYANMPFLQCYFYSIVGIWAVGGQAFYYPKNTGFVIGTDDSPNSYMMEIHYDNPKGIEGRKDSSGLRFFYTSNLRKYDAGIIAVGESSLPFMVIPPKQESWISTGYCPKQCSQESLNSTKLPEKGINVFAAFLHTHLQGTGIWTKHVRDGVELPEIVRDDNYDFNFQDIQVLSKEVHVKPGDDLITYCKYQTMDKNKIVVGGLATSQEMCVDMLFYYPKMEKDSNCNSIQYKPVHDFIGKYFPQLKPQLTSLHYNPLVAMNITWTKEMVADLRKRYDEAKTLIPTCKHIWGQAPPYNTIPIPRITKPLPPPKSKCQEEIESNSSVKAAPVTFVLFLSGFMAMFL
ncbi:hypothetical protein ACROYT_G039460 [Oculina patagonica]